MIRGIHYLWCIHAKGRFGFFGWTSARWGGFLMPDRSHCSLVCRCGYGIAKWHVCSRPPCSSDGGGKQKDLDERHDLQGWKVGEDSLQCVCQTKQKRDLAFKPTPLLTAVIAPWPMGRALKQANPSPHRLRRHISRFKKSTLQNAMHNDDAGSQGSDNPRLSVHRSPLSPFGMGGRLNLGTLSCSETRF